jgi:hAT family C-terminal dimerisation region
LLELANLFIGEQTRVLRSLESFIPSIHWPDIRKAFLLYYTRQGHFREEDDAWEEADNPELFWQLHWDDNNLLAKLAIRVFYILANEVSSERVFSAMKILHSKPRNRLTEDRVDKLLFIQINLRTLRRRKRQSESQNEEIDESESEDEMDGSPYQIVPWVVQRVSSDASTPCI